MGLEIYHAFLSIKVHSICIKTILVNIIYIRWEKENNDAVKVGARTLYLDGLAATRFFPGTAGGQSQTQHPYRSIQ